MKSIRKKKSFLLLLSCAGVVIGVAACRSRKFDSKQASKESKFNDNLGDDFDQKTWSEKVNALWSRNIASANKNPNYAMPDPSPNDTGLVFGSPGGGWFGLKQLPNLRKAAMFVADSVDFQMRSLESIASLTVYSRLRDVYPTSRDYRIVGLDGNKEYKHKRATHPHGTLAKVKFIPMNNGKNYTGMFAEGATGLARISGATNTNASDVLNRSVAIKFPVTGSYSRSLFAMNRVIGQQIGEGGNPAIAGSWGQSLKLMNGVPERLDWRYFKEGKNLTNILPPAEGFEGPIVAKFGEVVNYILKVTGKDLLKGEALANVVSRLSVDNMAWHTQNGELVQNPKAPYRVTLVPSKEVLSLPAFQNPVYEKSDWRKIAREIPLGTPLWTVYGVSKEDEQKILSSGDSKVSVYTVRDNIVRPENKIGTIVAETKFVHSEFVDFEIMNKHFVADMQTREDLDEAFKSASGADELSTEKWDELPADFLANAPKTRGNCVEADAGLSAEKIQRFSAKFPENGPSFKIFRTDTVPFCLPFKSNDPNFPVEMQGVWWMNGNPVPELLLTFTQGKWNESKKSFTFQPGEPNNWAWYASRSINDAGNVIGELEGITVHDGNFKSKLTISFDRNNQSRANKMVPYKNGIRVPGFLFGLTLINPVEDKSASDYVPLGVPVNKNEQAEKLFGEDSYRGLDMYLRRTKIVSGLVAGDYQLTRIINPDGQPNENYQAYLDQVRKWKLTYSSIYAPGAKLADGIVSEQLAK